MLQVSVKLEDGSGTQTRKVLVGDGQKQGNQPGGPFTQAQVTTVRCVPSWQGWLAGCLWGGSVPCWLAGRRGAHNTQ